MLISLQDLYEELAVSGLQVTSEFFSMLQETLPPSQIHTLAQCVRALRDVHTAEISGKELELAQLQEKLIATEEKLRITRNDLLHELLQSESTRRRLESENFLLKRMPNNNVSKASEAAELKEKTVEEKVEAKELVGKGMKEKGVEESKSESTTCTKDASPASPKMAGSAVITEPRDKPDTRRRLQEVLSTDAPNPAIGPENTPTDDLTTATHADTLADTAFLSAVEVNVPTFDGKFYEWNAWHQALKTKFQADSNLFLTEESKIEYMRSHLKQGPLLQATALPPGMTANTLLRRLELRFGPTPNRIKQVKEEVEKLKLRMQAEESLLDFLRRFLPVINALELEGEKKIRGLRQNLPESLASKIEDVLYHETFEDFVDRCKEVDLELGN